MSLPTKFFWMERPVGPFYSCVDCDCVLDPFGPYSTLSDCLIDCCGYPPPPPPTTDPCPGAADSSQSILDCDGDPIVPPGGAYEIADQYSNFGMDPNNHPPDECSIYLTNPAYTITQEVTPGCCDCLCAPSDGTSTHATVSTTSGPCGWDCTIELFYRPRPVGTLDPFNICWDGECESSAGCSPLRVNWCCNCGGLAGLGVAAGSITACTDTCCTTGGTCPPLEYTGDFCCIWFNDDDTLCGDCCIHVVVTL